MKHAIAFLIVYGFMLLTIYVALATLAPGSLTYLRAGVINLATGD